MCTCLVQVNFINHFSGCQLCTQQNKEGDYGVCEAEYTKSYEYASSVFAKLLKRMPPRDITHQMQLAATPYCKVRAWSPGCAHSLSRRLPPSMLKVVEHHVASRRHSPHACSWVIETI